MSFRKKILSFFVFFFPLDTVYSSTIQFWGDFYLPNHVIKTLRATSYNLAPFKQIDGILSSADINIINFEGVISECEMPMMMKKYTLRMPYKVGNFLRLAKIHVATLANNHSMDYGDIGLFDTLLSLQDRGIKTTGAGGNLEQALKPVVLNRKEGRVCVSAFNKTLPQDFWAKKNSAGSASLSYEKTANYIKNLNSFCDYIFISFHWGNELQKLPKNYQRELARLAIDNGASAVIGHHPHVLLKLEIYKNKPIFYSLGNSLFATKTIGTKQEGVVARFHLKNHKRFSFDFIPLNVQNNEVEFRPRPTSNIDAAVKILPKNFNCKWDKRKRHHICSKN